MHGLEINHYKINKRDAMLERLKGLGFNYEAHSFGITVMIGGKMCFFGTETEIEKWLQELKDLENE